MIRKDVIFAVATTFCLCALMFTVIPIRSGQPYDPWTDLDESGKIDMKDIASVASRFGTAGDSTKNVNVTNWPSTYSLQVTRNFNASWPINANPIWIYPVGGVDIQGYSRMAILLKVIDMSPGPYNLNISLGSIIWLTSPSDYPAGTGSSNEDYLDNYYSAVIYRYEYNFQLYTYRTAAIETKGPYAIIGFCLDTTQVSGWAIIDFYVYLRND